MCCRLRRPGVRRVGMNVEQRIVCGINVVFQWKILTIRSFFESNIGPSDVNRCIFLLFVFLEQVKIYQMLVKVVINFSPPLLMWSCHVGFEKRLFFDQNQFRISLGCIVWYSLMSKWNG